MTVTVVPGRGNQQLAKKRSEVQKEKKKEARERELLSRKQRQLKDKQVNTYTCYNIHSTAGRVCVKMRRAT